MSGVLHPGSPPHIPPGLTDLPTTLQPHQQMLIDAYVIVFND